jgi:hypothetical protein
MKKGEKDFYVVFGHLFVITKMKTVQKPLSLPYIKLHGTRGYKEMSSILADQLQPCIRAQMQGGGSCH